MPKSLADFGGVPEEQAAPATGLAAFGGVPAGGDDGYQNWLAANGVRESGDYDYRGAFEDGFKPDERGHWDDRYKLPNHPTFSTESKYSGRDGKVGGRWIQGATPDTYEFHASQANLEGRSKEELMDYFDRVEPGNKIRFPDGTSYASGDRGPVAAGDEDQQMRVDDFVSGVFKRAQRGDATRDLEAADIAEATGVDPDLVKTQLDDFRAQAKLAQENPRRWRIQNPDLFELLLLAPRVGPSVVREQTVFKQVSKPEWDKWAAEHPWQAIMGMLAEGKGPDEMRTIKVKEKTEMADMSHLSANEVLGESFMRTAGDNAEGKREYARMWAHFKDPTSPTAKAMDEARIERRIDRGLENYYGDSKLNRIAATIGNALGSQSDSLAALGLGSLVGLVAGRFVGNQAGARAGMAVAKVAGAATSFVTETGSFWGEAYDTRDDKGNPIDPKVAFAAANAYGVLASAVETLTIGVQGKSISTLNARKWARSMLTDATKRGALMELATTLGKNAASEGGEEGVQQAMQLTLAWLAKNVSAGELQRFDLVAAEGEVGSAALQGAIAGSIGISTIGGISNAAHSIMNLRESARSGAVLAGIHEVAKTEAAQKAPRNVAAWISAQQQEDGRKITHLYVDPTKLVEVANKGQISISDVATQLMGDDGPRRLQEALDRHGPAVGASATLEVPMTEYLEKWGSKPIAEQLIDDMTTAPGRMTMREQKLFQSDVDAEAGALADATVPDEEGVSAEEAALVGNLEQQLVASGRSRREARQAIAVPHAFARVMSKLTRRPASEFLNEITVQGIGTEKAKPEVQNIAQPAKRPSFRTAKEAFESLEGFEPFTSIEDSKYNAWRANKKGPRPAPFGGDAKEGTFDVVNEHLELKGDQKVSGMREAFDRLFHRATGSYVERAQAAINVLKQVPGLEGLRLPDKYLDLNREDDRQGNLDLTKVNAAGELVDENGQVLFQGGVNSGEALQAELEDMEDLIRGYSTEYLMGFDANGKKVISLADGKTNAVTVTPEAIKASVANGNVTLTHNHPSGSVFSPDDIGVAIVMNVAVIRATTPDGGVWIMRRPVDGWGFADDDSREWHAMTVQGYARSAFDYGAEDAKKRMDAHIAKGNEYDQKVWNRFVSEEVEKHYKAAFRQIGFNGVIEYEPPSAERKQRVATKRFLDNRRLDAELSAPGTQLTLLQTNEASEPRGWIKIARAGAARQFRIFLTKKSDASTFMHESAHAMFETFEDIAKDPNAPARITRDWATLRKWAGVEEGADLTVEQKEKLARAFEAYLLEGRAPSSALAEAFASFRRWLLDIYKSVAKLGVELNDDVRSVFDRMLATDREIEQARAAAGLTTPIFSTPQEAGVDPRDFDAYLQAQEKQRSAVIMRTQRMIYEAEVRAAKAFKSEEHRKLVEQFRAEYDAMPEVRVWRYLVMGELNVDGTLVRNTAVGKLSRDEVIEALGRDSNLLSRLRSRLVKGRGGESIVDVAQMFDLPAEGLLARVASLPDRDDWARDEADRAMRAKYPEIDGEIANLQEAIQRLQHVDSYDEAEREWQMIKARTTDHMTIEALQRAAKLQVQAKKVGRLDPGVTLNRERAFASAMAQAVAEGNFDRAMIFAHKRLLYKYLWKELMDARDLRDNGVALFSDMIRDESRARLGKASPEYRDIPDSLLEAIQVVQPRPQDEPRSDMGQLMGKMATDGNSVAFDPIFIKSLLDKPRDWRDLTVGEFGQVVDALKNIRAGARNVTTILRDGKRVDIEEMITRLIELANQNVKGSKSMASTKAAETILQSLDGLASDYDGLNLRPETILEFLGWDELMKPLVDAKHKANDLTRETVRPISEMFDKIPRAIRNRLNDNIDGKALFPDHIGRPPAPTKRYELLMLALNAGNESNLMRLLGGRNITAQQVQAALSTLTEAELQWVQGVWDQIETLWPHLREMEERDSGLPLEKIQAKPFTVTSSDGKTLSMRGGYFPAVYDSRMGVSEVGTRAELQNIAAALDPGVGRPSTNKSATKKRAERFEDVISLEPVVIQNHIVRVVHDIAYREVIRSSARIFLDPRIKSILVEKLGEGRARVFEPWLRDIGRMEASQVDDHGGRTAKLLRSLRSNVPIAVLGHAIDNYLGDTTAILTALIGSDLSKQHYAAGFLQYASNPFEARKLALAKSGELRSRGDNSYQGFAGRMKSIAQGKVGRFETAVKQHAFFFAEQLEKTIVTPVWLGGYRQAQAKGLDEAAAVEFADTLVRKAFPSKSVVDKAAIQRDKGVIGFASMFVGYANWAFNQYRRIWNPVFQAEGTRATALAAASAIMSHIATAAVIGPLAELIVGHGPEPDEAKSIDGWRRWFMRKLLIAHLMPLPLIGGLVEKYATGKVSDRGNPGVAAIDTALTSLAKAAKDDAEPIDRIIAVMRALGYLRGLPVVRPTRALEYLTEGDYDNDGGIVSGILYGERRKGQATNPISLFDGRLPEE